jgi:histidinol phosphatase-like enzyme
MEIQKPRVVAFDFDGVIASYEGFVHANHVRNPIPAVVEAIRKLKADGFEILIHSTRGDAFLKKYCEQFSIPFDHINHRLDFYGENPGKPIAFVYVDDRNICYKGQSADELVSEIKNFKAYWQK